MTNHRGLDGKGNQVDPQFSVLPINPKDMDMILLDEKRAIGAEGPQEPTNTRPILVGVYHPDRDSSITYKDNSF